MSFVHDVIKIKMVREGYLPNYPPHLISDDEMCDAFLPTPVEYDEEGQISKEDCMFHDYYPLVDSSLADKYHQLVNGIAEELIAFKEDLSSEKSLPNWIYSYMLGAVIGVKSSQKDIHDILVPMNVDNIDDVFTKEACQCCYMISEKWLSKLPQEELKNRYPTLFGAPHVIKYIRLNTSDMV